MTTGDPLQSMFNTQTGLPTGLAPLAPVTETDIRVLQQVLAAGGYDPGVIDGRFGARTLAALQAFQRANNWTVTSSYDDATRHSVSNLLAWISAQHQPQGQGPTGQEWLPHYSPPPGQAPPPQMPAVPQMPSQPSRTQVAPAVAQVNPVIERLKGQGLVGDELYARAAEIMFPQLAGLMGIADLRPILIAAAREEWTGQELQFRVQATDWWRTTPERTRAWIMLSSTDPASAERMLEEQKREFDQLARQYLMPMSDQALTDWVRQTLSGEVPEDAYRGYLVEQAKSRWPSLSAALDSGITVDQYVDPYRQTAARELEINPAKIDFLDPKWMAALDHVTESGERTSMSLADWVTKIRSEEIYGWDKTTGARNQAAQFAAKLAETFGAVG